MPRYSPETPRVGTPASPDLPDLYVRPTALTLAEAALSAEAARSVVCALEQLAPCEELTLKVLLYQLAQEKFGQHWRYADLHTALWAAAKLIEAESYLEIGVCRGWSAAVVASVRPEVAIYGFDLWDPEYRGIEVPGPDFVRGELSAVGHRGPVTLVSGDSGSTVPAFLAQHPELYFDVVTIDGTKSVRGVAADLANVLPRLKVGGIVLFDDMPVVPTLRRVWEKVVERDGRFVHWEFRDAGSGVAAAIRVSDQGQLPLRLLQT
jgi:predicted O-methyltransferase YrrM